MSFSMFGERLELRSEVEIARDPETVFAVLVDLPRYHEWNPYLVAAKGVVQMRAKLKLVASFARGEEESWTRRVVRLEPPRRLAWAGSSGPLGLLSSEQFFELSETSPGHTRLRTGENVRGLLVRPSPGRMLAFSRAMASMNQALKHRLESAAFEPG